VKKVKNRNGFVDALAMDLHYAVLTKPGRVQVLVRPTPKALARRGKRGWHLFGTVESRGDAGPGLQDILTRALASVDAGD
jgi:hypothetical protein